MIQVRTLKRIWKSCGYILERERRIFWKRLGGFMRESGACVECDGLLVHFECEGMKNEDVRVV